MFLEFDVQKSEKSYLNSITKKYFSLVKFILSQGLPYSHFQNIFDWMLLQNPAGFNQNLYFKV